MYSRVFASLALVGILALGTAHAQLSEQLLITEIMWDSGHPSSDDFGNGGHVSGDWWELLNVSDEPIDMTGFMWDDDDRLEGNDFSIFPEFVIQPKELVILVREEEASIANEDGFRVAWDIPADMRILSEGLFADTGSGDTFSGLSSGGDELNLYDAMGELIQSVTLEPSTTGVSRGWSFADGIYTDIGLSVEGEAGAVASITDGSGNRLAEPELWEEDLALGLIALDVSSAGHVEGFDVVFPGGNTALTIDEICSQVAVGSATGDDLSTALAAAGVLPGDADQNGTVEFADFLTMSASFGQSGTYSNGDFDCNGTVEFADFLALSANFGQSPAGAQSVPEPATGCLLLLGLSLLGHVRQRRS